MEWRHALYILGFIGTAFFGLRVLIQWISREKGHKSQASQLFWIISLSGNLIMVCHYFIQFIFPFCLVQVFNAVVAWRNINLNSRHKFSLSQTIVILVLSFCGVTLLYGLQSLFVFNSFIFALNLNEAGLIPSFGWNLLGAFGAILFASRFVIQWIDAEKSHKSELKPFFWKISIAGTIISLIYGIYLHDKVIILGHALPLIPYLRNLILEKKAHSYDDHTS